MKRIPQLLLFGFAACGAAAAVEPTGQEEAQLAAALEGRTAGPATSCVNQRNLNGNRSIGEHAILFDGPGRVLYVNRPPGGCPRIDSGRTLVTRSTSTQLCRGDIVTVVDPVSGTQFGSCGLGDFTPYRPAEQAVQRL